MNYLLVRPAVEVIDSCGTGEVPFSPPVSVGSVVPGEHEVSGTAGVTGSMKTRLKTISAGGDGEGSCLWGDAASAVVVQRVAG